MSQLSLLRIFFTSAVLLTGGCVTSSFALNVSQDTGRFALNDTRLGQETSQVLIVAERHFGQKPSCSIEKTGVKNSKRAAMVETCTFSKPVNVFIARQKVLSAQYRFIDLKLQQIDIDIDSNNTEGTARQELESEITASLGLSAVEEGPVKTWIGDNDAVLLARQGHFKLRVISRLFLPDVDYTKITPRK